MEKRERLRALRAEAKNCRDPAAADDTLALLVALARLRGAENILEIGTAEGLTSVALLLELPHAKVTTIEADEARHARAKANFSSFGVEGRVRPLLADASDALPALAGPFDLIFLDGPKAQYVNYLPDLARLLAPQGLLFADDILLYGWVNGREETPPKRRSIVRRIRDFLAAAREMFVVCVLDVGEGAALCVRGGFTEEERALICAAGVRVPLADCFPGGDNERRDS